MTFLTIEGLHKRYQNAPGTALNDFSLSLIKGQRLAIIGESGSGKSTLLRIIAGLEVQDEGTVTLSGNPVLNPSQKLVAGYDDIQLIHQQFKLYPFSTAEENIKRPLIQYDKTYVKERTSFLLDLFGLTDKKDRLPKQLSGGEQQKVAIARALSIEPELLLLDEPFSNLDAIQKRVLLEELHDIFEEIDLTVIWVTHDLSDALAVADELCVMRGGKIVQRGKAAEIFSKPKNRYVASMFSRLNQLGQEKNKYIRPQHVLADTSGTGMVGVVKKCQFRLGYNHLTVLLEEENIYWRIQDSRRVFNLGDRLILTYNEKDVLVLEED
ncbi:ABC transporter ATP-binding protein [Lunatibacter salilacus]|uniref:ABC transporter ATP-binding protein n=1 Tax=Lunatibacter salilacus TaxID=2483804 RepID=UPI00131D2919|nr:ABC transporter ATP-binding protein [Lunatibacter salilacus]